MKRKILGFILISLAFLSGCSLSAVRTAKSGVLDLRELSGTAPLTGEWIVTSRGETHTAPAPLRPLLPAPPAAEPETWSLTAIPQAGEARALLVPFPSEISEVYADFERIWASSGAVSEGPVILPLPEGPSLLLRLEIPAGGRSPGAPILAAAPLLLGTQEALKSFLAFTFLLAGVHVGAFGGALLVSLLFALLSRRGRGFLSLALYLAGTLAFFLVRDAAALGWLSPDSGFLDRLYSGAWSLHVAGFAVLALTLSSLPLGAAVRAAVLLPAPLLAAAALIPLPLLPVHAAALAWGGLLCAALTGVSAVRVLHGDRWSLPVLLGALILAASYGARWITPDSLLLARILEPAGAGIFTVLVTLTIIRKVGDAFDEAENLSAYVDSVSTTVKRFIPSEFMDFLQKTDVTDLRLGDHVEKDMTIFFSDIRGFTQLSESLTEEQTFAFVNSYLARMVPVIKERGGFVDKYVGDAIMALFPDSGGADQALRAALEMQNRVVEYNRHRASVGYRPIEMGIGIHTGALMLGVVGVQDRMENTVISDAVNLASRLQAIAKAFNIGVVISEQSFKSLEDPGLFKYRFIGKVRVKGKADPVSCFEIFGDTQDSGFDEKMKANTYFEQGMLRYYQKEFLDAFYFFQKALEILPQDGAARFYMDICWNKKG